MNRVGRHLFLIVVCLAPVCVRGQGASHFRGGGLPLFYQHFSPQDYHAFPQNWAVVQDRRGLIYVANQDGVLEYDGTSWRLIRTAANTSVRSLAVDPAGSVYVGATGEIGYLAPDSTGSPIFVSLQEALPPAERTFDQVWSTHALQHYVYFQTSASIFRWDGRQMQVWRSENGYHTSFAVNGRLYVREKGVGLLTADGDELRLVPGGERFLETRIFVMAPYDEQRILVGTREEGFLLFDGQTFTPFATEADAYLQQHRLYHGCALPGGYFALATLDDGGAVVIDREGRVARVLAAPLGLPDGWVNYVFADALGGLWLALNNKGLVRADVPSPMTRFTEATGLEGNVYAVREHNGSLYVATSTGVYRTSAGKGLHRGLNGIAGFDKVDGISSATDFLRVDGTLLAASTEGLYEIRDGHAAHVLRGRFWSLERDGRRIYAAASEGITILENDGGAWKTSRKLLLGSIRSVARESAGVIWAASLDRQVFRFHIGSGGGVRIDSFRVSGDLAATDIVISNVADQLAFVSQKGIFRLREDGVGQARFVRDSLISPVADRRLLAIVEAEEQLWMVYPEGVEVKTRQADGTYLTWRPELLRFPKWGSPSRVFVDDREVVWLSSGATLYRYAPQVQVEKPYDVRLPVLIRRVTLIESNRLAYGGGAGSVPWLSPELSPRDNAVRIEFAAPSYNDPAATVYQFRLDGRDEEWSAWTPETVKQYTNLSEGTYVFRVRARNAQGVMLPEGRFTLSVLPPWYRSWWAYGLYACVMLALAFFGWRYRVMLREHRKARQQAEELARERVLNERLQHANVRLQEANDRLTQVDRLKDEFLANTSHELRTPLTAILGFASILKEEATEEHQEFVSFIEENGQRLLKTLDSLLDLARLRAGTMEVECERIDVGRHAAEVARSFATQAARKGVDLDVFLPERPLHAWLDGRCLDGIMHNLLGNAVKFTEAGRVWVRVVPQDGRVLVEVGDTGIGIEESFMPHLFDEFKQESSGLTRTHEGSGLGLAVTYRLVRLMNGEITAESRKGEGSRFTISFPVDALQPLPPEEGVSGDGLPSQSLFVN